MFKLVCTSTKCISCQNKEQFVDDSFPPLPKSLFYDTADIAPKFDVVKQWLRPKDIAGLDWSERNIPWTVFRTPRPSDISQGILGNCWYAEMP